MNAGAIEVIPDKGPKRRSVQAVFIACDSCTSSETRNYESFHRIINISDKSCGVLLTLAECTRLAKELVVFRPTYVQ